MICRSYLKFALNFMLTLCALNQRKMCQRVYTPRSVHGIGGVSILWHKSLQLYVQRLNISTDSGANDVMCSTTVGVHHILQQARVFIMEVYRQIMTTHLSAPNSSVSYNHSLCLLPQLAQRINRSKLIGLNCPRMRSWTATQHVWSQSSPLSLYLILAATQALL